jgi:hypothetical protein
LRIAWYSISAALLLLSARATAFDKIVIDAEMHPDAKVVAGTVQTSFASLDSSFHDVHFRLYWNSFCAGAAKSAPQMETDLCGTTINAVWVNGQALSGPYELNGTDLVVPIPTSVSFGRPVSVKIDFTSHIPAGGQRFGFKGERCFLYGWFPMPAPIRDGHWLNLRYEEFTELAADCYDISGTFRLPESLQVFGSGLKKFEVNDHTKIVSFDLPSTHDFDLFTATGYESDTSLIDGIRLITNFRSRSRFVLDTLKATIRATLEYMGRSVHPYPFDELVVLGGGLAAGGGLELPRFIILEEPRDPFSSELYRILTIHETIHQWFYGVLNSNQALDPWMDESVTMYFNGLISAEMAHGRPDRFSFWGLDVRFPELRRFMARPYVDLVPVNLPVNNYHDPLEYFTTVYDKGYMVMNTLFGLLSDSDRDEFFHRYYAQYQFKSPTPEDLLSLLSQYEPYKGNKGAWKILESTDPVDFQISRIRVEQTDDRGPDKVDASTHAVSYKSTVTCTVRHGFGLPVDVRIEFYDGTVRDTVLVPVSGDRDLTFISESPARGAIIDPKYRYAMDINLLNNSYVEGGAVGAGLRLSSGITFLIQSLFSSIWGM